MKIESVIFKRDELADWEDGVMIAEGCGPLIDLAGHVVPAPIWSWHPSYDFIVKARETDMSKQYNRRKTKN